MLRLTKEGLATKRIAQSLGIAHGTARNHLSSAIAKLHATSRIGAAERAEERGWI